MKSLDLEARIAGLPCWRGQVTLEPLHGGLSSRAFVVDDGSERYVARCGGDIPAHHVFRDRERAASVAAHAAGLSPEVVYAEPGVMVIRHIDGRTLAEPDLREYGGFGTAMFDLANLAANGSFSLADERLLLETYFGHTVSDEVQRAFDAMNVASALREALWAMVSAIHLAVPGADYGAHATEYLSRTRAALSRYAERHGNPEASA
jgi:thiamine kinase-like enzyme